MICNELGKPKLLGSDSELGKFLSENSNIELLKSISTMKRQEKYSNLNPFQNLTPQALYVNCDLQLLEKISTVEQQLTEKQDTGKGYSKFSTKEWLIVGISFVVPGIGSLIAYGIIKHTHEKEEKAPLVKLKPYKTLYQK